MAAPANESTGGISLGAELHPIRYWENPRPEEIADQFEDFLLQLEGPIWIYQQGRDSSRCRVASALIHGNEPSGFHAIHRWLRTGLQPAVDLYFFIGATKAAQALPLFSNRHLPDQRDLNRCFRPPFNDENGQIAAECLHRMSSVQPEAVIDIHNTSGAGPCFAVACNNDRRHQAITRLFCNRLIITDIRLGALMEFEEQFTVTTIECGGAHDPQAHEVAWRGLKQFASQGQLFSEQAELDALEVFRQPLRVELFSKYELAYGESVNEQADLTLVHDIERYNFGTVPANTHLGWLGPQGLNALVVRDSQGISHTHQYFRSDANELQTNADLKLFMITKNSKIAKADCLFYLVPAEAPA